MNLMRILTYIGFILLIVCEYLFVSYSGICLTPTLILALLTPMLMVLVYLSFVNVVIVLSLLMLSYPFQRIIGDVEIGIITFNIFTIGIVYLFFISFIKIFITKKAHYKFSLIDFLILFLCMQFLLLVFVSTNTIEAGFFSFNAIFIPVVSYFVVKSLVDDIESYKEVVLSFLIGVLVFSFFCIFEFLKTKTRIWSPLNFPIGAATILFCAFIFVLYGDFFKNKPIKILFLGVVSFALFTTYARAYIAIVVLSPVVYFCIKKRFGTVVILSFLLIGIGITFFSMSEYMGIGESQSMRLRQVSESEKRLTEKDQYLLAMQARGQLWREGIKKFQNHPVIGNGFYAVSRKGRIGYHNNYIDWLAFGGALGLVLNISILISQFLRYDRSFVSYKSLPAGLTILVGILANGFGNGLTHGIMPTIIFVILGFNEALFAIHKGNTV